MLEIKGVTAGYRPQVNVLQQISMTIPTGEFVAILGANGAGKSTLARTISGVLKPRDGEIWYNGKLLAADPQKVTGRGIVQVPEARGVFGNLSVVDNLRLGAYSVRDNKLIADRIENAFEMFPILREKQQLPAGTLSGGQQQMLAIGRGLMAEPELLIVDEPSLGLAPNLVEEVLETLTRLNETGVTVILIEQNALALEYCRYVYVLRNGRVVVEGPPGNLIGSDQLRDSYL